jgi:hypothetical protein
MRQLIEGHPDVFQIRSAKSSEFERTVRTLIASVKERVEFSLIVAAGTVAPSLPSQCTKTDLTFRAAI